MQISIFYQMLVVAIATTAIVHSRLVSFSRKVTLDDRQVTQGFLGTVEGNTDVCGETCALDPLCVALSVSPGQGGVCRLYSHVFRGVPASLTFDPGARYFRALLTLEDFRKHNVVRDGVRDVILPDGSEIPVNVEVATDGVPWVVVLRRQDGSEDFYRDWEDYAQGFGDLSGEFWIGNEHLHALTAAGLSVLRVDLEDAQGGTGHSLYNSFNVGDSSTKYALTVTGYNAAASNAGDALTNQNGMPFSTKDRDNPSRCAARFYGGWWYSSCYLSNLTGRYGTPGTILVGGVVWYKYKCNQETLRKVEMKLRLSPP